MVAVGVGACCRKSVSAGIAPTSFELLSRSDVLARSDLWPFLGEPDEKSLSAAEREKLRQYNTNKRADTGAMGDELTEDDQRDMEGLRADDPARDPSLLQFQLRVARSPDQVCSASWLVEHRYCLSLPWCCGFGFAGTHQVVRYRLGGPPLWAGRQHREHRPIQVVGPAAAASGETGAALQPYVNRSSCLVMMPPACATVSLRPRSFVLLFAT
jgi:hypothetical protein